MTPVGQKFIDLLDACLDSTNDKKMVISLRQFAIMRKCYDFEDSCFPDFEVIAQEYKVSAERVRQIHNRTLHKIREADANRECLTLSHFMTKEIDATPGNTSNEKIINFWHIHLKEFPAKVVVRLVANLTYPNQIHNMVLYKELKKWKRKQLRRDQALKAKMEKAEKRTADYQNDVLSQVRWFDKKNIYLDVKSGDLFAKRVVNHDSDYVSGTYQSKKCGREIQYESTLELAFIKALESFPKVRFYVEQPIQIKYNLNDKIMVYTPDVAVYLDDGQAFLVEVKDFTGMADERTHKKMEALVEYCHEHGMGVLLTDGRHSIDKLLTRKVDLHDFENELISRMNEGNGRAIFFYEFKEVQKKYNAKWTDFLTLVLKNNWTLYPFPFKLTRKSNCKLFREVFIESSINHGKIQRWSQFLRPE